LQDAGIVLRPLEFHDQAAWYAYLSRKDMLAQTSWVVRCIDDLTPLLAAYHSTDADSPSRFAIIDRSSGKLAGTIGFHTVSSIHKTAEIAYEINPDFWGKGIAAKCCATVVEWGFKELGLFRIQAMVLETNQQSLRVLQKCNFELEGKLRNLRLVAGVPRDFFVFSVLKA